MAEGAEISSKKEFHDYLSGMSKELNDLFFVNQRVGSLKRGEHFMVDGKKFGKKEVRSLNAEFVKQMKALSKYAYHKRKAPAARRGGNRSLNKPKVISEILANFFKEANLGYQVPGNASSGRLQDWNGGLYTTTRYISTNKILTYLFTIYSRVNDLAARGEVYTDIKKDGVVVGRKKNNQYVGSDALMNKYFNTPQSALGNKSVYDLVREKEQENIRESEEKDPSYVRKREKFSLTSIQYTTFQSISAILSYKDDELDASNKEILDSDEVANRLEAECQFLQGVNNAYKVAANEEPNKPADCRVYRK